MNWKQLLVKQEAFKHIFNESCKYCASFYEISAGIISVFSAFSLMKKSAACL